LVYQVLEFWRADGPQWIDRQDRLGETRWCSSQEEKNMNKIGRAAATLCTYYQSGISATNPFALVFASLLGILTLASPASADIMYSNSGTFSADDARQVIGFSLAVQSIVTLETWSFAGGTNANTQAIAAGGFSPVLSLFQGTGVSATLLTSDSGGTAPNNCGPRSLDASTGFCLDAYLSGSFSAGAYFAVLTEYDNTPNGPTYGDGFLEDGMGNFTGGPFFLNAGPGFQRSGSWAVDITSTGRVTAMPEPSSILLLASLTLFVFRERRRKPGA
jgi:hypothetical protein